MVFHFGEEIISGEYGGYYRISHCQRRKRSVKVAEVWLLALSWRMMGFRIVVFSRARTKVLLQERAAVDNVYHYAFEVEHGAVLTHQCHTPQWTSPSQHIVQGALSLDEESRDVSIHLIDFSILVHIWVSSGFVHSNDSSKKVVIFSLVPVQQGLCGCIAVPLLHLGISWCIQHAASLRKPECCAECWAQFSYLLRLPLLTHGGI